MHEGGGLAALTAVYFLGSGVTKFFSNQANTRGGAISASDILKVSLQSSFQTSLAKAILDECVSGRVQPQTGGFQQFSRAGWRRVFFGHWRQTTSDGRGLLL